MLKITKRENHDELIKDSVYAEYFNKAVKQAEFLASLGIDGHVLVLPDEESWLGQGVIIQNGYNEFKIHEDYHKKFQCRILNVRHPEYFYSVPASKEFPIQSATFYKLTTKKLQAQLDNTVLIYKKALALEAESTEKQNKSFNEAKTKIDYIAKSTGLKVKSTENAYEVEYDAVFYSAFGYVCAVKEQNGYVKGLSKLNDIVEIINKIKAIKG